MRKVSCHNLDVEQVQIGPINDAGQSLEELVDLLDDAVADGASVGFLAPLDRKLARDYWLAKLDEARAGTRVVLGAWFGGGLLGSIQLAFPAQENGKCRAEIQRLIVLRAARRRGIGTSLVRRLEAIAHEGGRKVLFLNTRTGDPPERMYLALGYTKIGTIPDFAMNPDGTLNETSILYKQV